MITGQYPPNFSPTEEEIRLEKTDPSVVDQWLTGSKNGVEEDLVNLSGWVYIKSCIYISSYSHMQIDDIYDLSYESHEAFMRNLQSIKKTASSYLAGILRRNLGRFGRIEQRERPASSEELEMKSPSAMPNDDNAWDDVTMSKYRLALRILTKQDEITRSILADHYGDPPANYEMIALRRKMKSWQVRLVVNKYHIQVRKAWCNRQSSLDSFPE